MMRTKNKLPGLLLGVLDGGALERRVMRLLETPWDRRWRVVSAIGCLVVMGTVCVGAMAFGVRSTVAQSPGAKAEVSLLHVSEPMPSYEVATVKKSDSNSRNSTTVLRYIQAAFNIPHSSEMRVVGGPAWMATDTYVIQGKIPDAVRDAMQKMNPERRNDEGKLMQQALLADRFKMRMHFETREMPVYELVVAKGGLKVKEVQPPSAADGASSPPIPPAGTALTPSMLAPGALLFEMRPGGLAQMAARANPMRSMANAFMNEPEIDGRPILDKTGLPGVYDFAMQWRPDRTPDAQASDASAGAPSLFTALQEQLGLRLVATKGPVEVVVIDSIERPTEN